MMSNGGAGVYVASGSAIDGIPDLAAQLARGQVGHRQTQLAAAAPRTIATSVSFGINMLGAVHVADQSVFSTQSANPTVHFPDVGAPIAAPGTVVTTTTTHTTTTTTLLPALAGKPAPPVAASDLSGAPIDDDASGRTVSSRASSCSVSTPLSPPSLPFLDHRPAPPETDLAIETSTHNYTLITRLPGFSIDCITLATKHHRTLHIVADKWDQDSGGHFERRITFGTDAEMKNVKAEFDGNLLKVFVPRRTQTAMNKTGGGASSSSSARF